MTQPPPGDPLARRLLLLLLVPPPPLLLLLLLCCCCPAAHCVMRLPLVCRGSADRAVLGTTVRLARKVVQRAGAEAGSLAEDVAGAAGAERRPS